jgi:DNA-binding beta-propeller fold protein YncE
MAATLTGAAVVGPTAVVGIGAAALGAAAFTPATVAAQQSALWYIATYTHDILVWDEGTEQVVDRITMSNFFPTGILVNEAKDRLYVREASAERIEIVDLEQGAATDELTLSEGNVSVRINGFAPHPSDERAAMLVKRYTKLDDRYVVEGPFMLEYDLAAKRVSDTIPWPDDEERENVGFQYSPDGRTLYLFTNDIIALDADTFEEVDRWEISQPLEPGLGRPSFGVSRGTYDEDGVATSLFRMTDPAQNRRMMGIARVRLSEKEVDFYTLGEAQPLRGFNMAPGGEKAYALYSEIGRYEFWEFDLVGRSVARRVPFAGRPRMGLQVSADGRRLYVHTAGSTIDVYDAATFDLLRTVTFEADMTDVAVVPGT